MGDAVAEADYKEEGGNCDNSAPLNAFLSHNFPTEKISDSGQKITQIQEVTQCGEKKEEKGAF